MTPSGIEPATFGLVAQYLNQLPTFITSDKESGIRGHKEKEIHKEMDVHE
jgi:hypothetical protein